MAKAGKPVRPGKTDKTSSPGSPSAGAALPICIAIVFCDQVITGKDNVLSAIRIVDIVGLPPDDDRKVGDLIQIDTMSLLVILKKGDVSGKVDLLLLCSDPSGNKAPVGLAPGVVFEGDPESGPILIAPLRLFWGGEGLYWIELLANNSVIGRTPLKIKVGTVKPRE